MEILRELRIINKQTQSELAQKLLIEQNTLSQYEINKFPSFKIIKKISELYKVSIDFLILESKCDYPRSFDFLNKAIQFQEGNKKASIKQITQTIETLIENKNISNDKIKQDNLTIKLNDNFHSNLKILRSNENIKQNDIANKLNIVRSVVGMYEIRIYPSVDKMIKLSKILNCSIHALVTGEKLSFDFKNKKFGTAILLADHLLSIEDKNFLIKLMNNLIKDK